MPLNQPKRDNPLMGRYFRLINCAQASGGGDTWVMRQTYGSPRLVAGTAVTAC